LIEPGLVRPLTIRDLVTVIPVQTDTIEWVREKTRTNNAAPVEEATALTGTSGTKPQGAVDFERVTDHIRTIAEWIPATKRILSDAGQLRAYIDAVLASDLALELEDQMVSGAGTGEEFLGILNDPDTQTQSGDNTELHDLRSAKRKVRTEARTNANGILLNPEDMENIDLLRDLSGGANTGQFLGQSPFQYTGNDRIWGLPVVESEAIDPGTAVVADFTRAILYDREGTNISVGTAGDDFIRNIVRILAELRAGFAIIRPKAFVIVTF
jgi:HK97 family phage major capsid protein